MDLYDPKKIEKKWQDAWASEELYKTDANSSKPKQYILDMFPYPSGEGLHVGHPKGYIATDIYSRFKRMNGFETLHPMGWDAFGLPAENFAIKNKVHPRVAVDKNIATFKKQLSIIGFDYDWSREINTTDPAFYKWTQWIFLKLLEKGLAYQSFEPINWCPSCQTGLANEDLNSDGTCERCDSKVEKKPLRQWVLKITDYADRMLYDLEKLPEWPEHIKEAQRNWIGKSEGAEISFDISNSDKKITVFTTRPDTLYGATYVVFSPEHPLITTLPISNKSAVDAYIEKAIAKSEIERTSTTKEKTGVLLEGVSAINPATKEKIPLYVADYVIAGYGTGAVMAVPAHDERDFEFALAFNLPIRNVIDPVFIRNDVVGHDSFVEKNKVVVIVEDGEGNVVIIHWLPELGGRLFVGGTVEEGESPEDAAIRELREETGFYDVKVLSVSEETFTYSYFAHSKNRACRAFTRFVHLRLNSKKQHEHKLENDEQGKFTMELIPLSRAEKEVADPLHRYAYEKFILKKPYTGYGVSARSGALSELPSLEAKEKITEYVGGKMKSTYRLQDWVFSRQRYWGEPIPVIHCEKCGVVPVPEKDLPVLLPEVDHYEPTGTGESPLANIESWVNVDCPTCGGKAKRETNTMPQWAGSSWYWLRFMDPQNTSALIDSKVEKNWGPVDVYVGGDHAVRHLIYARFWHKFLYDLGVVHTEEPFTRLEFLGFVLAEDGRKMSKRLGNVINPDDVVSVHGADAFRTYSMFMGPFENTVPWSTNGIIGAQRFIEKVWRLQEKVTDEKESLETVLHQTIQKVTDDIEAFKFNTAVSSMMIFVNAVEKEGAIGKEQYATFVRLLAPFAPHIAEELWRGVLGHSDSIHHAEWPVFDPTKVESSMATVAVQIGGKTRGSISVPRDATEEEVKNQVKNDEKLSKYLDFKPQKVIYVTGKIINFVP